MNISHIKLIPPQRPERKVKHQRVEKNHVSVEPPPLTNGRDRTEDLTVENSLDLVPVVNPGINDRVVWIGEDGYERATVKWIGTLPDDGKVQQGETLVGVEFVSF